MEHNGTGPRHRRPRPDAATGATALQERPADGGEAPTSIDLEPSPANAKWRALLAEGGPILAGTSATPRSSGGSTAATSTPARGS